MQRLFSGGRAIAPSIARCAFNVAALGLLAIALASCSTGHQADPTARALGCRMDAMKVCQAGRFESAQSEIGTMDPRRMEQNGPATVWETYPISIPDGPTIEFQCSYNAQHRSVVYATGPVGPALNEHDVAYLRQHRLCVD